jgi:WS/DGAT/MGAT family acyltransferase
MAIHPMHPVDAAWYHIDSEANPAIVTGLVATRKRLDFAKVRAVFAHRLATIDRFRRRVVEHGAPLATPHWEDVPDFDIDRHLHHVALPAPGDDAALAALLDDLASAPLRAGQPLWQAHVVDGVGGGSVLVLRYHHCIGDGLAMMAVAQRLFGRSAAASLAEPGDALAEHAPRTIFESAFDAAERAAREAIGAASAAWHAVEHPQQTIDAAARVFEGAGMLVGELLKTPDPASPLKGEFQPRQHVAWSAPLAVADLKAAGAPFGATVNDVLVFAVAGALREYLKGRGVNVDGTTVRAMVPVNLRPPERFGRLGNEFGLVILELPVAIAGPMQRLAASKTRMDALKRSPEAVAMHLLFDLFGRGPKRLEDFAQSLLAARRAWCSPTSSGRARRCTWRAPRSSA